MTEQRRQNPISHGVHWLMSRKTASWVCNNCIFPRFFSFSHSLVWYLRQTKMAPDATGCRYFNFNSQTICSHKSWLPFSHRLRFWRMRYLAGMR
ncbi:hypothetical protein GDO81_016581 [Engystomops pustulosus]|uniref:Uncharacterized protein n=1 Tax=Engystomops pustulosus TaxID=76066 RepID=A0AAV7AT64_ENGPU|nr:hypothetical protein GDO81_016581 [Engystomops pustulosus]